MHDRVVDGLPRTNNAVESWHVAFQSSLQCAHPTLWKLITAIGKEEDLQSVVLAQTLAGMVPIPKAQKYRRVSRALKTLITNRLEMPVIDFLRGCSYNVEMLV
jgi:hypothetical protein